MFGTIRFLKSSKSSSNHIEEKSGQLVLLAFWNLLLLALLQVHKDAQYATAFFRILNFLNTKQQQFISVIPFIKMVEQYQS